jgi:hypothetical protein
MRVASPLTESTAQCIETMEALLFTRRDADPGIALSPRLARTHLDFSLTSLQSIDRYLIHVHDNEDQVAGVSLLTTIWAIALYVGEVIRRTAPARQFEWVTIAAEDSATGQTTINHADVGMVRALRSRSGEMTMPSRAVLRVILRGAKARTIEGYALGIIQGTGKSS